MLNHIQVNKKNTLAVAEHIRGLSPERFDMLTWFKPGEQGEGRMANTSQTAVGCIAYWTVRSLRPWELAQMTSFNELQSMAAFLLGLDLAVGETLFNPKDHPWGEYYYHMNGEDAARTLRHLALTGEIIWEFQEEHDPSLDPYILEEPETETESMLNNWNDDLPF